MVKSDGLLNDLAKLVKHRFFIWAVTAIIDETRRTANVALVFLGPLNDLCITRTFLHATVAEYALF